MATTYDVRMTIEVHDGPTRPLAEVLGQALAESSASPVVTEDSSAVDDDHLRVRMFVDAADSSIAELAARDALVKAVRDAGLSESSVRIGDPEVRTSA